MFKDLPWEKKEKLYIIVLFFSMFANIFSIGCLIYVYRAISAEMAVAGL